MFDMDPALTCVIVADDLTGACDSAVQFAAAGLRTTVAIAPGAACDQPEVLAFSTESRALAPEKARNRIRELAAQVREARAEIVFKKIDSTLRGNTAVEVIAALDAFGCDAAVVNPAFPAMARVAEGGMLRVASDAGFAPVEIAAWLRQHGAEGCRHVLAGEIAAAIARGARFISLDALCADDLSRTVAEGLALKERILWAGSAGLASALARHSGSRTPAAPLPYIGGPLLFILGSDHPVTMEQQCRLLAGGRTKLLDARGADARQVRAVLGRGHHLVLRLAQDAVAPERLAELLPDCRPAATVVSGGDTLSAVCHALRVRAIDLRRELAPGIPAGILRGGVWSGSTVVTKSGGFGAPDALLRIGEIL